MMLNEIDADVGKVVPISEEVMNTSPDKHTAIWTIDIGDKGDIVNKEANDKPKVKKVKEPKVDEVTGPLEDESSGSETESEDSGWDDLEDVDTPEDNVNTTESEPPGRDTDSGVWSVPDVFSISENKWRQFGKGMKKPRKSTPRSSEVEEEVKTPEPVEEVIAPTEAAKAPESAPKDEPQEARYIIGGVIDPCTNEEISFEEAIEQEIIDVEDGVYFNRITGHEMTLPQALAKGLIKMKKVEDPSELDEVESTQSAEDEDYLPRPISRHHDHDRLHDTGTPSHHKGKIEAVGYVTVRTTQKITGLSIKTVIDDMTGRRVPLKKAIVSGLLDPENGLYHSNRIPGKTYSIEEAVQRELLIVDDGSSKTPDRSSRMSSTSVASGTGEIKHVSDRKTYAIYWAMDTRAKKKLDFQHSVRSGILRLHQGQFRDTETGKTMPVGDAIVKGFVNARPID